MLTHELSAEIGLLIIRLDGPLQACDFTSLARLVDGDLDRGSRLHGVLISGKSFPGWANLDGLIAHLKFVRDHHSRIDKVAIVADGLVARLMPGVASHFLRAQLQHFDDEATAMHWLKQPAGQGNGSLGKEHVS